MLSASFTLAVTRPQSTGLGGGGFILLKTPEMEEPIAIDFREKAPHWAFQKMFTNEKGEVLSHKSKEGIWAAGVPGMISGLLEVHERYGKLPLTELLQKPIELARKGFPVNYELALAIKEKKDLLSRYPASKKIFLKGDSPLEEGDLLLQEDLAKTLEILAREGKKSFYQYNGLIAKKIIKEEERLGGLMDFEDLADYAPVYRKTVHASFRNYEIYSMAPPSSGGLHILEILNIIEQDPLDKWGASDPRSIHLISSAMQLAFADRAKYLGDPDFVSIPVKGLLSKDYAKSLRNSISMDQIKKQNELGGANPLRYESKETTHLSLMDKEGNMIASTQNINGLFGSGIVV
jgi:gamma-glutamyltranspeptidase/glutathione hydrolase